MDEEAFAKLTLADKWAHIHSTMNYITKMDLHIEYTNSTRTFGFDKQQKDQVRNLRKDQYERWAHLKNLYAAHRDELANTLDNDSYSSSKNIIERIFTLEVDDALNDIIGDPQ